MRTQKQWLFEAPFPSKAAYYNDPYSNPEYESNLEIELALSEMDYMAKRSNRNKWEDQRTTERIPIKRKGEAFVLNPGIPGADNRMYPDQGRARAAALAKASVLGPGHSIAHDPRPSRGMPHYHVVDPQGNRVSGHFFYGSRTPRRVLRSRP